MGCCGQSAQQNMDRERVVSGPDKVYVNFYPDGSTEETLGQANAEARQRAKGGTYRLKAS